MIAMLCKKCGYEWVTKSTHVYVSCPSCMSKVRRVEAVTVGFKNPAYDTYVKELQDDPAIDTVTGEIIPPMSYAEWCLAINPQ